MFGSICICFCTQTSPICMHIKSFERVVKILHFQLLHVQLLQVQLRATSEWASFFSTKTKNIFLTFADIFPTGAVHCWARVTSARSAVRQHWRQLILLVLHPPWAALLSSCPRRPVLYFIHVSFNFHPLFIQFSSTFIHFSYTFIHFSSTFGTLLADTPPPSHPELLYYPPPAPVGRFFIQSGQFLFLAFVHFFDIGNPPTHVSTLCHILGQLLITTCCQQ